MSFKLALYNAHRDPIIVKEYEPAAIRMVEMLDDMQMSSKLIYTGLQGMNDLIMSLPNVDPLSALSLMHNSNFNLAEKMFRNFYFCEMDIVDTISDQIDAMSDVSRRFVSIESGLRAQSTDIGLIKFKISQNENFKNAVAKLFKCDKKLNDLYDARIRIANSLLGQLSSLIVLEKEMSQYGGSKLPDIMKYDLTYNREHLKNVTGTMAQYLHVFEDLYRDISSQHVRFEESREMLDVIMANFRKQNGINNEYYAEFNPMENFESLHHTYNKLRNAITKEQANLEAEIKLMDEKAKYGEKKNQNFLQIQRIPDEMFIAMNHPKIIGLGKDTESAKEIMRGKVKRTQLALTELNDCLDQNGKELKECVRGLRGTQRGNAKDIQKYIDKVQLQQQLSKDQVRYAEILMLLYQELGEAIKNQQLKLVDNQEKVHKEKILEAIELQMAATRAINENMKNINGLRHTLDDVLSSQESMNVGISVRDKNREKLMETQNQLSGIEKMQMDFLTRSMTEANLGNTLQMSQKRSGLGDETAMLKSLDERVRGSVKDGTSNLSGIGQGLQAITGKTNTDDWKLQEYKHGDLDPDHAFVGTAATATNVTPTTFTTTQQIAPVAGPSGNPVAQFITQAGGGHTSAMFLLGESPKDIKDRIIRVIDIKRKQLYGNLNRSAPSYELEKLKIDIQLKKAYDGFVQDKISSTAVSGTSFNNIVEQIQRSLVISTVMSKVNTYIDLQDMIQNVVHSYRAQNQVVLEQYARLVRSNRISDNVRGQLETAYGTLMGSIKSMEESLDQVNAICSRRELKVYNLMEDPKSTEFQNAAQMAYSCAAHTDKFVGLCSDITTNTITLLVLLIKYGNLVKQDFVDETLKEINMNDPSAIRLMIGKAQSLISELTINIGDYMYLNNHLNDVLEMYSVENSVVQSIDGTSIEYMKADFGTALDRVKTSIGKLSGPKEKFVKATQLLNSVYDDKLPSDVVQTNRDPTSGVLSLTYSDYTNVPANAPSKFNPTDEFDDKSNLQVEQMITLEQAYSQRNKAAEEVFDVLYEVEKHLMKARMELEKLSCLKMKHYSIMMKSANKSIIDLFIAKNNLEQKFISLNRINTLLQQYQGARGVSNRNMVVIIETINASYGNLLKAKEMVTTAVDNVNTYMKGGATADTAYSNEIAEVETLIDNVKAEVNSQITEFQTGVDTSYKKLKTLLETASGAKGVGAIDTADKIIKGVQQAVIQMSGGAIVDEDSFVNQQIANAVTKTGMSFKSDLKKVIDYANAQPVTGLGGERAFKKAINSGIKKKLILVAMLASLAELANQMFYAQQILNGLTVQNDLIGKKYVNIASRKSGDELKVYNEQQRAVANLRSKISQYRSKIRMCLSDIRSNSLSNRIMRNVVTIINAAMSDTAISSDNMDRYTKIWENFNLNIKNYNEKLTKCLEGVGTLKDESVDLINGAESLGMFIDVDSGTGKLEDTFVTDMETEIGTIKDDTDLTDVVTVVNNVLTLYNTKIQALITKIGTMAKDSDSLIGRYQTVVEQIIAENKQTDKLSAYTGSAKQNVRNVISQINSQKKQIENLVSRMGNGNINENQGDKFFGIHSMIKQNMQSILELQKFALGVMKPLIGESQRLAKQKDMKEEREKRLLELQTRQNQGLGGLGFAGFDITTFSFL